MGSNQSSHRNHAGEYDYVDWYRRRDGRYVIKLESDDGYNIDTYRYTMSEEVFYEISDAEYNEMISFNNRFDYESSVDHLHEIVWRAQRRIDDRERREREQHEERERVRRAREAAAREAARLEREERERQAELAEREQLRQKAREREQAEKRRKAELAERDRQRCLEQERSRAAAEKEERVRRAEAAAREAARLEREERERQAELDEREQLRQKAREREQAEQRRQAELAERDRLRRLELERSRAAAENEERVRRAQAAAREVARLERKERERQAELDRQKQEQQKECARILQQAEQRRQAERAKREILMRLAAELDRDAKDILTQFTGWLDLSRTQRLERLKAMPRPLRQTPRAMILGRTNAGKTTLINTLYGLTLPTAATENTMGMQVVHNAGGLEVVDTFGYNDSRSYLTAEMAEFLLSVDRVVLVYTEAIEAELDVLNLLVAARCDVMVVRSKCDTKRTDQIEEIRAHDVNVLAGVGSISWLAVSSESMLGISQLKSWLDAGQINTNLTGLRTLGSPSDRRANRPYR
jgi:small GTP-binding protein